MCDCGQPGTKRDGSGLFCEDCERMVNRCSEIIHRLIVEQRSGEVAARRQDYLAEYRRNKTRQYKPVESVKVNPFNQYHAD